MIFYRSNISVIDVGMEDAMAAGAWPEKENPNTTRINEIIDYVKQVNTGWPWTDFIGGTTLGCIIWSFVDTH